MIRFKRASQCLKLGLASASLLMLTGCETVGYYAQAVKGHLDLNRGRQPIERALADERLKPIERERLALVPDVLNFAGSHLHLPAEDQYETLVFMNRNAVTWNVFAAPADSLAPKTWCFPIIGCISYRGYFAKEDAQAYAKKISEQGWETYVGGASAYSTLGWFEDPILSTFLKRDTPDFIGLLFHELAHVQLYIKDDTTFNESFATAVEQAGVLAWYAENPSPEAMADYLNKFERRQDFLTLAMETKAALTALYAKKRPSAKTQTERKAILENFRTRYADHVSNQWQGKKPYGGWMQGPLNNAQWNTLGAYYDLVPAFTHLLTHLNNDFKQFYVVCEKLGKLPKAERYQLLAECDAESCAAATKF